MNFSLPIYAIYVLYPSRRGGLVCSLLHLSDEEVISVEITNPIILGDAAENKEFRLDINVLLNNNTLINLEMQIANKLNWPQRSVMYLCRSFDQINHGQDYLEAKPAIHIGFLNYTLFENNPEFYASYKLINVKNHQKYSDSLTLNVVDLSRIDLATEEDKQYRIHEWAKLFQATTWEEIKMIASQDEYLNEASQSIFRMSADEMVRKRCRDREEYYQDLRNYERVIKEKEQAIERGRIEHEQDLQNYERVIEENQQIIAKSEQMIRENKRVIETQTAQLAQLRNEIEQLKQPAR